MWIRSKLCSHSICADTNTPLSQLCYYYIIPHHCQSPSIQLSLPLLFRPRMSRLRSPSNHQGAACAHVWPADSAVWWWLKALLLRTQSSYQPCMCSHKHFNWCETYKHGPDKNRGTCNSDSCGKKQKCRVRAREKGNARKHSLHFTPNNLIITRGKLAADINKNELSINNTLWMPQFWPWSTSNTACNQTYSKIISIHTQIKNNT